MDHKIDIVAEPQGQTYIDLLNFAASRCGSFSLVWRVQFKFDESAHEVKRNLKPFLISNDRTTEWPGTKLIGHEAIVGRYKVTNESVKILQVAGALYSWLQPKLPEDLVFYTSEEKPWLVSISHEAMSWFTDASLKPAEIYAWTPHIVIRHRTAT